MQPRRNERMFNKYRSGSLRFHGVSRAFYSRYSVCVCVCVTLQLSSWRERCVKRSVDSEKTRTSGIIKLPGWHFRSFPRGCEYVIFGGWPTRECVESTRTHRFSFAARRLRSFPRRWCVFRGRLRKIRVAVLRLFGIFASKCKENRSFAGQKFSSDRRAIRGFVVSLLPGRVDVSKHTSFPRFTRRTSRRSQNHRRTCARCVTDRIVKLSLELVWRRVSRRGTRDRVPSPIVPARTFHEEREREIEKERDVSSLPRAISSRVTVLLRFSRSCFSPGLRPY